MPVSAYITSVDTLQTRPAAEAFVQGSLPSGEETVQAVQAADLWGTSSLNWGLMALCIILILLFLRRFISVIPYVAGGMARWREIVTMEGNMRLSRERDSVAAIAVLITCVCISRLDLFQAQFIHALAPGIRTLAVVGTVLAALLVRGLIIMALPSRRMRGDTAKAAGRAAYNLIILISAWLIILTVIYSISAQYIGFSRKAAIIGSGVLWFVFLFRKYQIMVSDDGHFIAFLYLCAVEILPAVMLVVSMFYL